MNLKRFLHSFSLGFSVILAGAMIPPIHAEEGDPNKELNKLARAMTTDIFAYRENVRIGFRPFFKGETSLDETTADRLYSQFFTALNKYKDFGEFEYVNQRHMKELLQSREEYYMANPTALLEAAQADIEIICHPQNLVKTMRLSCVASDLETAITYSTREAEFPFSTQQESASDYRDILKILAESLAKETPDLKTIYRPVILDMQKGQETEITQLLGRRLVGEIQTRVNQAYQDKLENYEANKVVNAALTPPKPRHKNYSLHGELNQTSKEIYELTATITDEGQIVSVSSGFIKSGSLPKIQTTSSTSALTDQTYRSQGFAQISDTLDADAARRGAINLARARLVSQATGHPAPVFDKVTTEAEASLILLNSLKHGIPTEERIVDISDNINANEVAVELTANVNKIGTKLSPSISAKLNKSSYQAGDKIHISLSSAGNTYIGVYGWFADGRMIRIYPDNDYDALYLKKGQPLVLPRSNEPQLITAPMPIRGNTEDQEAIVIIASNGPYDFKSLAPEIGESLGQTIEKAATAGDFFNRLGNMDTSRISLTILPYQVHN